MAGTGSDQWSTVEWLSYVSEGRRRMAVIVTLAAIVMMDGYTFVSYLMPH